jgi:ligand-binding sensor domain-containing protein
MKLLNFCFFRFFEPTHRKVAVVILLILFPLAHIQASEPWSAPVNDPYSRFRIMQMQDGLSANRITDIIQDRYHFMWIATSNGLNSFDGNKIRKFGGNEENQRGLSSGVVSCVKEDANGNIWAGTEKGLFRFRRELDIFEEVVLEYNGIRELYIRAMLHEGDSLLWIEVQQGALLLYNKKADSITAVYPHPEIWQHYYMYHALFRDSRGMLWFGGRGTHPMFLDPVTNKIFTAPVGEKSGQKPRADISDFLEDKSGNFWVTGNDGIFLLDRDSMHFTRKLRVTTFTAMQTRSGELWFGTGSGIFRLDPLKNTLTHIVSDINNSHSIPSDHVNCIYEDPSGTLWIGTDEGVAIFRSSNRLIKTLYHIPGNPNTIASDFITALKVYENKLWVGHRQHGLDIVDFETGSIKHIRAKQKANGLFSDKIRCLYEDQYGDLYIGLWDGVGFARKRKQKHTFENFTKNKNSREIDWYNDFAEDKYGNFYLGFWGGDGLQIFDRKKGVFGEILKDGFSMPFESRLITRLFTVSDGNIWIGTTNAGAHLYNPEEKTSQHYFHLRGTSLANQVINDFYEDASSRIWIAADSLYCYDPKFETFKVWGKEKGLSSARVFLIIPDQKGNLWIGTDKGILCFNPLWNFSISFPDLAVYEMSEEVNAGLLLENGELVFGSKQGICIFNPEDLLSNRGLPDIFITAINIKGTPSFYNPRNFSGIELEHDENFFGIEFSNSDISATEAYAYRYRLQGLEDNWTFPGKGVSAARYTNVPPGDYVLEIELSHDAGNWEFIKSYSMTIKVNRPFWQKIWFYLLLSIIIVSLVLFIIREILQRQFIHRKNAELKELLLRAQINPHFIFNALVAIQGFVYKKENIEAGRYLGEFSKLIRLTLENTRQEYITLSREIEFLEYYLKLQQLRYNYKFQFSIIADGDIETELLQIPPMLTQPFIENSIEHGLSEKEGDGLIEIKIAYDRGFISISVEDNGIGRNQSQARKAGLFRHKSFGTEITQERLDFLRKKYRYDASFSIEDLSDKNGNPSGTRANFKIPILATINT